MTCTLTKKDPEKLSAALQLAKLILAEQHKDPLVREILRRLVDHIEADLEAIEGLSPEMIGSQPARQPCRRDPRS